MKSVSIVAQGGSFASFIQDCCNYGGKPLTEEVWAINATGGVIKHDLLFHMDDCRLQESRPNKNIQRMMGWLREHPKFFTSKVYEGYPGAMAYPLEDVLRCIGYPYFNGTVAYALAYAIYMEMEEIRLYGCDFSYAHIHKAERGRACVEWLIGIAMSRGIHVYVPNYSTLMDNCEPQNVRIYGYDAYDLKFVQTDDGYRVRLSDKPLPSGEEIEKLYMTLEEQNKAQMGETQNLRVRVA